MQPPDRGPAEDHGGSSISVIISAFTLDRWEDLTTAIDSVRAQTSPAREIILVVDHAPEVQARAEAELPGVTVVPNTWPQGLSGARQSGAAAASGAILAFLDDDAVAEPQWLAELERAHADERALGAGGEVVPDWAVERPSWFPAEFNFVVGCHPPGMKVPAGGFRNPIGANMAMRAEVMRATGEFAHALGRSGEGANLGGGTADETEFCIRAAKMHPGHHWVYRPDARVHHKVQRGRNTWSYFVRRCRMEGRSKALLTGMVGSERGLASERDYLMAVLPRAVLRELRSALRGDRAALARAGAIVAGVLITAVEYLHVRGRIRLGRP
jgi:glycosyltransferase involved in cell wall biosynthesis